MATPGIATGRSVKPPRRTNGQYNKEAFLDASEPKLFNVQQMKGDGNLLVLVNLFIYDTQEQYMKVRLEAVNYVQKNWKGVENHIKTTDPQMRNKRTYCYAIRKDETFRTIVEIQAISGIHKIQVNVYTPATQTTNQFIPNQPPTVISKTALSKKNKSPIDW